MAAQATALDWTSYSSQKCCRAAAWHPGLHYALLVLSRVTSWVLSSKGPKASLQGVLNVKDTTYAIARRRSFDQAFIIEEVCLRP